MRVPPYEDAAADDGLIPQPLHEVVPIALAHHSLRRNGAHRVCPGLPCSNFYGPVGPYAEASPPLIWAYRRAR